MKYRQTNSAVAVPSHYFQEICLALAIGIRGGCGRRQCGKTRRFARLGLTQLRVGNQTAHDCNNIQHCVLPLLLFLSNDDAAKNTLSDLVNTVQLGRKSGLLVNLITV